MCAVDLHRLVCLLCCAPAELREEAHIQALDAQRRGTLTFEFEGVEQQLEVHVFLATQYTGMFMECVSIRALGRFLPSSRSLLVAGEPTETEEMRPQWFAENFIPFDKMWKVCVSA